MSPRSKWYDPWLALAWGLTGSLLVALAIYGVFSLVQVF